MNLSVPPGVRLPPNSARMVACPATGLGGKTKRRSPLRRLPGSPSKGGPAGLTSSRAVPIGPSARRSIHPEPWDNNQDHSKGPLQVGRLPPATPLPGRRRRTAGTSRPHAGIAVGPSRPGSGQGETLGCPEQTPRAGTRPPTAMGMNLAGIRARPIRRGRSAPTSGSRDAGDWVRVYGVGYGSG